MLPTMFGVNRPFASGEEVKNGLPIGIILAIFLSTSHSNASYKISCQLAFVSGEEVKNRFSRWWLRRPSWISDWNDFS